MPRSHISDVLVMMLSFSTWTLVLLVIYICVMLLVMELYLQYVWPHGSLELLLSLLQHQGMYHVHCQRKLSIWTMFGQ